jgi:hypothetical protein
MKILLVTERPAMAIEQKDTTKTVLLVEDNLGDVRLTLEAFQDTNKSIQLKVASDALLCKPVGFELFDKLVLSINRFWLADAKLPQPAT